MSATPAQLVQANQILCQATDLLISAYLHARHDLSASDDTHEQAAIIEDAIDNISLSDFDPNHGWTELDTPKGTPAELLALAKPLLQQARQVALDWQAIQHAAPATQLSQSVRRGIANINSAFERLATIDFICTPA